MAWVLACPPPRSRRSKSRASVSSVDFCSNAQHFNTTYPCLVKHLFLYYSTILTYINAKCEFCYNILQNVEMLIIPSPLPLPRGRELKAFIFYMCIIKLTHVTPSLGGGCRRRERVLLKLSRTVVPEEGSYTKVVR